jgi:type I restriction enzyme S subunit
VSAVLATKPKREAAWRTVPLSRVCQFKPPKSICRNELAGDAEVSFVPMNDLGELVKYFEPKEVRPFAEVVKSYTYFADGDVLCAKITPCFENGKLGIARDLKHAVGFGSSEFVVMRANDELLPEFLYYFLSRDAFREAGAQVMSGAVGHKRVPNEYFEDLLIPLPSQEEQKRIVAALDQAFAALDRARANAEANLADAELLYASAVDGLMQHHRDLWRRGTLNDLVGEIATGPFGSLLHKSDYVEAGIPIVNPSNIVNGRIEADWSKTISAEAAERLRSYRLRVGDLVIGRRGEMGRCAPVWDEMEGWICGTGSFILRLRPGVSAELVGYLMRSRTIVDRMSAIATGATMPNLSNRALGQMSFELPGYQTQLTILDRIKRVEAESKELRLRFQAKLADLAALRQSLLQKAFAGELA